MIVDAVLGLKRRGAVLHIDPCLPEEWGNVTIRYKYKTSLYIIQMIQEKTDSAEIEVVLDDEIQQGHAITLADDGKEHDVKVNL